MSRIALLYKIADYIAEKKNLMIFHFAYKEVQMVNVFYKL